MPRVLDPRLFTAKPPKDILLFAYTSETGDKTHVFHFNDECFVIPCAAPGFPHGNEAVALTGETAIWAYKQVRLHRFYWLDKRLLIKRIFRTTNLTLWQKHRETGFTEGLVTTLLVTIVGPRAVWIGSVGDTSAFFFQDGKLMRVTRPDSDNSGRLTKTLGTKRLGIIPHNIHQRFVAGDTLLLVTSEVTQYVPAQELVAYLGAVGTTQQSLSDAVDAIFQKVCKHQGTHHATVCLIKRVANPS